MGGEVEYECKLVIEDVQNAAFKMHFQNVYEEGKTFSEGAHNAFW